VRRTILALAAAVALFAHGARAQESIHPKNVVDPEEGLPLYQRKHFPSDGWMSPDDRRILAISRATIEEARRVMGPPPPLAPVVMHGGMGGLVNHHITQFSHLEQTGAPVEMRGGCCSACTLITGFIPKERLCFALGAFLAFHAARTAEPYPRRSLAITWQMYAAYPSEIKSWIDNRGGPTSSRWKPTGPCPTTTCGRWATRGASDPDL
jgi:hypothetical protein